MQFVGFLPYFSNKYTITLEYCERGIHRLSNHFSYLEWRSENNSEVQNKNYYFRTFKQVKNHEYNNISNAITAN